VLDGVRCGFVDVQGRSFLTLERHGKRQIVGARIDPQPIPAPWKARLGAYDVINGAGDGLNLNMTLREESGLLVAQVTMPDGQRGDFALRVVRDDEAVAGGSVCGPAPQFVG
jgi:hypothetical protein